MFSVGADELMDHCNWVERDRYAFARPALPLDGYGHAHATHNQPQHRTVCKVQTICTPPAPRRSTQSKSLLWTAVGGIVWGGVWWRHGRPKYRGSWGGGDLLGDFSAGKIPYFNFLRNFPHIFSL